MRQILVTIMDVIMTNEDEPLTDGEKKVIAATHYAKRLSDDELADPDSMIAPPMSNITPHISSKNKFISLIIKHKNWFLYPACFILGLIIGDYSQIGWVVKVVDFIKPAADILIWIAAAIGAIILLWQLVKKLFS